MTNTEFSAVHVSFIDLKFYVCFINLDIYIKQLKFLEGEHEVFPWLQTFITRRLRGIQIYKTVT